MSKIASQINIALGASGVAGRAEALGLLISCLEGPANLNTAEEFQDKTGAKIGRIGAGVITGANIISNEIWDEDWSITGSELTNNTPVIPNAGGGFSAVTIGPNITLGQLIYLLKTAYMTVEHLKQMVIFGQLMQGDMDIEEFFTRVKKIAKFYDMHDNIVEALAEAEKFTLSQKNVPSSILVFLTFNSYPQQNTNLQSSIKFLQKTISRVTKTLDTSKKLANKRAEDLIIRYFLSNLLRTKPNKQSEDDYNYNPINDIIDNSDLNSDSSSDISSSNSFDSDTSSSDSSDFGGNITVNIAKRLLASGQNDASPSSNDLILDESSQEKEFLDDSMKIYFIQKKELKTSVATIKCKIKRLNIPAMTLDFKAEPPIITKNIVDRIRGKIDKSEKYDLNSVATVPIESISIVHNLPITLALGFIIHEDFIVVDYYKPMLIFFNQLLKKYGCVVD
ncbi:hypothetical protein C1645_828029 [Glomus cerebriforme]|uniref:Uncharacterized protein n=1 Tax=Glomus cerebriforme TaxID=658196 RepID=A0A397SNK3_9GLOM|nr:hypothetical protein C1645_828029 [Glomus cerebriforme]